MKKQSAMMVSGFVLAAMLTACSSQQAPATEITMYKNPNCGCCGDWAKHLRHQGFTVIEQAREDMDAVKTKYGVSQKLASCHTALIDGYVIEGHVPASDVQRLLKNRPDIVGLAAPGMPMQSPGMQAEGKLPQNYDVLAFDKQGNSTIYQHY